MLTLAEWRQRCNARKRGTNPTAITEEQSRLLLYAIGIGGEGGEILEHAKKHVWHDQPLDRGHLLKEMGDVLWYLDQLAQLMGFTLEEVATANDEKLTARHPDGFSSAYHEPPKSDPLCQCGYRFREHQMDLRCPKATDDDVYQYYVWLKTHPERMDTAPRIGDPRCPYFTTSEGFNA